MAGLFALAVIPSAVILLYVWRRDRIEKEPVKLLAKLFLFGGLAIIPAGIIEMLGSRLLGAVTVPDSFVYNLIENVLVIGLTEEAVKFAVLKKCTWDSSEFDYTFDAVIYAVTVSLGFATFENIMYVLQFGATTGLARAFTSIPGHAAFSVFMGNYYGIAKCADHRKDTGSVISGLRKALWIPALLHGAYDLCVTLSTVISLLLFAGLLIMTVVIAVKKIKRLSLEDRAVAGDIELPPILPGM